VAISGSTMLVFSRDAQRRAAAMMLIAYLTAPKATNPWAVELRDCERVPEPDPPSGEAVSDARRREHRSDTNP
jgi:hypothetical protein